MMAKISRLATQRLQMFSKTKDAQKRKVEIINLHRLQMLLLTDLRMENMDSLPLLTKDSFKDRTYEPAKVQMLQPGDETLAIGKDKQVVTS